MTTTIKRNSITGFEELRELLTRPQELAKSMALLIENLTYQENPSIECLQYLATLNVHIVVPNTAAPVADAELHRHLRNCTAPYLSFDILKSYVLHCLEVGNDGPRETAMIFSFLGTVSEISARLRKE